MKRILFILFIIINCLNVASQSFPVFSQYISNGLIINPAYTGSREVLSLNLLYRNQWVGFDGSPVFQTLSAHAPLKNANIGLGFQLFNEKSGPIRNTQAYFNYAYRIKTDNGRLALGLKAGFNYYSFNWKDVYLNDQSDAAFNTSSGSFILPNCGVGAYYYSRRMFMGFSVPYIFSYKRDSSNGKYVAYHDFNNYDCFLTGGYLLDFSKNFKLKPSVLLRFNPVMQQQLDMNLTFIFLNDKIWISEAYRMNDAISSSIELQVNPQLRFGYAFDYSGLKTNYFKYTSHEIFVRYEFSYKIKAFNPRYF
jgi:type IX secretion system PorP/SprF family membrane protein